MPVPSLTNRRGMTVLATAIALLLTAAVVAAAVDDDEADGVLASQETTTTTEATSESTGTTLGSVPVTAGEAPAEPSDTAAPAPTAAPESTPEPTSPPPAASDDDLGEPQDPGPTSPPRAGVYRYRITGEDGNSAESDTTIRDLRRDDGEVVQEVEGGGGGFQSVDTYVWTADQVVVASSVYSFGDDEADCDWEPDVVYAKLPLKKFATWESTSKCAISGFGPTPIVVNREQTGTVTGLERRRVAGEVLDLWVIDADVEIDATGFRIDAQTTNWFSPKYGLIVRTEGSGSGGTPTESGSGSFTSEILNLSPR